MTIYGHGDLRWQLQLMQAKMIDLRNQTFFYLLLLKNLIQVSEARAPALSATYTRTPIGLLQPALLQKLLIARNFAKGKTYFKIVSLDALALARNGTLEHSTIGHVPNGHGSDGHEILETVLLDTVHLDIVHLDTKKMRAVHLDTVHLDTVQLDTERCNLFSWTQE
ncbi:hypothetical protein EAG_08381 [Camponotus floridanus]|uniref:Uncharacterized protein n=1 Tax=Camponotus floridanus TaxID=104421 RepID=E2A9F2_CAMFO|nr:hypothetical protein EAG_08381 [Camponotus floridanus]